MRWMIQWCMWRTTRPCQFWRQLHARIGGASCSSTTKGDPVRAMFLWASAIEVQHFPPPPGQRCPEPGGLPPVRAVPCTWVVCERCDRGLGGFAIPFVGTFSKRDVLVQAGHSPAQAWDAYHWGEERLSILDVANVCSGLMVLDILPIHAAQDQPRGASPPNLRIAWRHWHQGRREWRELSLTARHAEHAPCDSGLARWRRDTPSCPAHVRAVDAPVCSVAAHAAGPHVVIAKGPASTASWLELGGAVAAAVLASNMSGIYALQAMGEDDADSHAYPEAPAEVTVVIDRMAAANVARFRRRHGLQVDTDFAYAFASWAEARDAGGQVRASHGL